MEPRNRCQGINSASLCSMAGRYDNPIPTRCLAPIDFLKIPALVYREKRGKERIRKKGCNVHVRWRGGERIFRTSCIYLIVRGESGTRITSVCAEPEERHSLVSHV
jgi:hypothetical protein